MLLKCLHWRDNVCAPLSRSSQTAPALPDADWILSYSKSLIMWTPWHNCSPIFNFSWALTLNSFLMILLYVHVCMPVQHMCAATYGSQKALFPGEGCGCWEPSPGHPQSECSQLPRLAFRPFLQAFLNVSHHLYFYFLKRKYLRCFLLSLISFTCNVVFISVSGRIYRNKGNTPTTSTI